MGLFSRRKTPKVPLLVESPVKGGERIEFDEQELAAIERGISNFNEALSKDKIYPQELLEEMSKGAGHEGLRDLARQRLAAGDYRGAAVTCIKALGFKSFPQRDWLLLAEINAEYGDTVRARGFLKHATEVNSSSALGLPESSWTGYVQSIERIIKRKEEE